jgi:SAM-dependent methyltransferase
MRRRRRGARVALDLAARSGPVRDVPGVGGDEAERRRAVLARALLDQGAPLPPEGIHAMTRGAEHVVGGLRHADLVAAALRVAGGDIGSVADGLDLGCSSGRVVRALAGAYPDVAWRACDPNQDAIAWASEHLRGIDFFVAPLDRRSRWTTAQWTWWWRSRSGRTTAPPRRPAGWRRCIAS